MSRSIERFLYRTFQRCLLRLPKLGQARIAGDKALTYLRVWQYLKEARVAGDYLEFGVFVGKSFDLSLRAAAKFHRQGSATAPRFFAFDSFEGLPEPDGKRDGTVFAQGEYRATSEVFHRAIRDAARGWDVRVIPGFYDQSLTAKLRTEQDLKAAAFVNIDCDLYPSTLDALRFVSPLLHTGSVLYFDDWFFAGGSMSLGEPGACAAWLKENPDIQLFDFGNVAVMGKLFIVNRGSTV